MKCLELAGEREQVQCQVRRIGSPYIQAAGVPEVDPLQLKQADEFLGDCLLYTSDAADE